MLSPLEKSLRDVGKAGEEPIRIANSRRYQEADSAEEAPLPEGLPEVWFEERSGRHTMQEVPRL